MSISSIDTFQSLGLATTADKKTTGKQELGQEQFLKLLTTQMTHQDPNKPMENGDFLAQMAQFSTVEGIGDLNESFSSFANSLSSGQALQAASLVGQSVLVPSDRAIMSLTDGLSGEIILNEDSEDLRLTYLDSNGMPVKTVMLGDQQAGNVAFNWDGLLDDGTFTDPGVYQVRAEATIDGNNTVLQTFVNAKVESVDLSQSSEGIQLSLAGLNNVGFNQVKKIF
jgi:flagellar basal-body rod modification protein FlgD